MPRSAKSASRAGPRTPGAPEEKHVAYLVHLIKSTLLVTTLALASLATQLALRPLYGSSGTALNHYKVKLAACLFSALLPIDLAGLSGNTAQLGLASWLGYAPYANYALAKWTTRWKNPVLGPTVTEAMVLVPAASIGVTLIRRWNSRSFGFLPGPLSLNAVVAIGSFISLNVIEAWLWSHLPLGGQLNSSNIFVAISGVITVIAAFETFWAPLSNTNMKIPARSYKGLFPFFLPIIAAIFALSVPPGYFPRPPYTRGTASPRAALTPSPPATVRVLARTHSVTGLILVGEHVEEGFRFLRADHSLLGGRWIGGKVAPGSRNGLGDSIYSTFVLQEAVRLIRRERPKVTNEHALFIGLGVGIAAEAFIAHGINTTVVEIDPAVYAYARAYFSLPEPNNIYLEDAREWLHNRASQDKYDYVVHDCFSGGGVPEHIFTIEFWEELKDIVKSDGVVAVNFAGKLASDPARAIWLTLQRSFGQCRAFHDHLEAKFDETYEFFNIVFFCTLSSSTPPIFRSATKSDYLSSHLRRHILNDLMQREIEPRRILGLDQEPELLAEGEDKWLLRDGTNRLGEWQQPYTVEHWTVMREVLPDVFWETY